MNSAAGLSCVGVDPYVNVGTGCCGRASGVGFESTELMPITPITAITATAAVMNHIGAPPISRRQNPPVLVLHRFLLPMRFSVVARRGCS